MKKILLAGIALAAFAGQVVAADLPPRPAPVPYRAPPPAVVYYSWTGLPAPTWRPWGRTGRSTGDRQSATTACVAVPLAAHRIGCRRRGGATTFGGGWIGIRDSTGPRRQRVDRARSRRPVSSTQAAVGDRPSTTPGISRHVRGGYAWERQLASNPRIRVRSGEPRRLDGWYRRRVRLHQLDLRPSPNTTTTTSARRTPFLDPEQLLWATGSTSKRPRASSRPASTSVGAPARWSRATEVATTVHANEKPRVRPGLLALAAAWAISRSPAPLSC